MDINYTHDCIAKAIHHLVTAEEPMPKRASDAYFRFAVRCQVRDGLESQFQRLGAIFEKDVAAEELNSKLSVEDAKQAAGILLEMYESWLPN